MRPLRSIIPACAVLFAASLCHARPTIFPATYQRCDDSYDTSSASNRDSPEIRIPIQESTGGGLKISRQEPTLIAGATGGLWRFNGTYNVAETCFSCFGQFCRQFDYNFTEPNGSVSQFLGRCTYYYTTCTGTNNGEFSSFGAPYNAMPWTSHPAPVGACPASIPAVGSPNFPLSSLTFNGSATRTLTLSANNTPEMADSNQWNITTNYTLSAWVRTSAGGLQRILSQQGGNYWGFGLNGGQVRRFDSREDAGNQDVSRNDLGLPLNDGAWHHVAVVRNDNVDWRYFIDGRLVGTTVAKSTIPFSDAVGNSIAASAFVGSYQRTSEYFTGDIDELRLMYGAYTDAGVQTEFNATVHRYSSDSGTTYAPTYNAPATAYVGGAPSDGVTTLVYYKLAGVPVSAANRWIVYAQGHDGLASSSPEISVTLDNSGPSAPGLTVTATAVNALQSVVTIPVKYCGLPYFNATYTLKNMLTGADVITNVAALVPTTTIPEALGAVLPNQRHVRAVKIIDKWGTSVLSAGNTVYTWTNAPTLPSAAGVSTGSFSLSWNANNNPGYTRYEVSLSLDNFATVLSTPVAINANHTTTSQDFGGLAPGTTYYFRIRSYNGQASDFSGDKFSSALSFQVTTVPLAPYLSGAALSISSVRWAWNHVPGASGYRLYEAGGGPLLIDTTLLAFTSSFLSPNTAYTTELETYNPFGTSARSNGAMVFTWARPPLTGVVTGVSTRSVSVGWNTNLNPAYTFYEVSLATDAAFGFVVSTLSTTGGSFTFDSLFPGTTYHARVRTLSGDQIPATPYAVMAATRTNLDAAISQSSAPASPYSPAANVIGLWHFDESNELSAVDSSGYANPGAFVCQGAPAQCVSGSSPTHAAGPPDLNRAAEFSGLDNTFVNVPDSPSYAFTGSMSLSAWVRPASNAIPDGAGLVVRGIGGSETFALDIAQTGTKKHFRFTAVPGAQVAVATAPIRAAEWDHVVAVFDDAANSSMLYINGVLTATAPVAPSRLLGFHEISIGNRQSAAAAYNRGFAGRIDEVRLMDRAMSAQEVVELYRSHFPTVLVPSAMPTLRITLPGNAFGNAATLLVTSDPLNHPITVPTSVLNQGLANSPTGQILIPNSMVEIVPLVGGVPFSANLGSSATLSFGYSDSNNDYILDGTRPQIPVTAVNVYTLNTSVLAWERLPTTLDRADKRLSASTPHFSIFALFGGSAIGDTLNEVRVFPIPWKVGTTGKFGASALTFDKLPAEGSVRIFTLAGEKVSQFSFSGPDAGRRSWNGRNDSGKPVASGLYFAQVQSSTDGSTIVIKFAVER